MEHSEKQSRRPNYLRQKNASITNDPTSFYGLSPQFSFLRYDAGASWCISKDGKPTVDKVFQMLRGMQESTWGAILNASGGRAHGTNSHKIRISLLSKDAIDRSEIIKIVESELYSLRLQGDVRLWGILEANGCFYVIWYDPEHKVFPLKKKHT